MVVVDPMITAKTERLLLRPLATEDVEDIVLIRSHPEVMMQTNVPPSNDIEKSKAWIQSFHDREDTWTFVVELLPSTSTPSPATTSPRVIGLIGAVRTLEVGYMLNADYWGKGYATEALEAFMPLFFAHYSGGEQERFEYAEAHIDTDAVASQKVLLKSGFEFHEKRVKDFESLTLGWRDTLVHRIYRPKATTSQSPKMP